VYQETQPAFGISKHKQNNVPRSDLRMTVGIGDVFQRTKGGLGSGGVGIEALDDGSSVAGQSKGKSKTHSFR